MDSQETQIIDRLKQATNILVTVSSNPSVDQLSAAIGLTLLLNKLGKNATAVFSGDIPSTIEFLQPEKTLEINTDSLRDFIIALDKSKAEKLRYKVEDQLVKIFITPYRTPISDKDLEFSQGDFNIEVVIALGVNEQKDLDQAITSHGRILHDATVISLNTHESAGLGNLNWSDKASSSLCEMVVTLGAFLKVDVMDSQMATALLTGIVAETDRFSNEKTTSTTMQISAKLMAAGANQQLVASQLQAPVTPSKSATKKGKHADGKKDDESQSAETSESDGSLKIEHGPIADETTEDNAEQIHIDEEGRFAGLGQSDSKHHKDAKHSSDKSDRTSDSPHLIMEPPSMGGTLTANSVPEGLDPSTDPLGVSSKSGPILSHNSDTSDDEPDIKLPEPEPETNAPESYTQPLSAVAPDPTDTLLELEKEVHSPHLNQTAEPQSPAPVADVSNARDAVNDAVNSTTPQALEPVQSLNAQPMDLDLTKLTAPEYTPLPSEPAAADNTKSATDSSAPPPVPPPMMPPPSDNPNDLIV